MQQYVRGEVSIGVTGRASGGRWLKRFGARRLPFVLQPLLLLVYLRAFHEPWFDEVQAVMLARSVSWGGLVHAMRLEGVAPLFHVTLKLLGIVVPETWVLPVFGALGYAVLLWGTHVLLFAMSKRWLLSMLAAALLALTDTFLYELGIMVRQYGLGLGLSLAACGYLFRGSSANPRDVYRGGLYAALAALTSVHAGCVAGGAVASFTVLSLARGTRGDVARCLAVFLPALAIVYFFIRPYEARSTWETTFNNRPLLDAWEVGARAMADGVGASGWWLEADELARKSEISAPTWLSLGLLGAAQLSGSRRDVRGLMFGLFAWLFSTIALLHILVYWHFGAYRHHLFLWSALQVMLIGWVLRRSSNGLQRLLRVAGAVALLPWASWQYGVAARDVARDYREPLVETRAAAPLFPKGARLVAEHDALAIGLLYWRDDLTLRAANGKGRHARYVVTDRDRFEEVPMAPLIAEECRHAPDRTFVLSARPSRGKAPRQCLSPALQHERTRRPLDPFEIQRVDCACAVLRSGDGR